LRKGNQTDFQICFALQNFQNLLITIYNFVDLSQTAFHMDHMQQLGWILPVIFMLVFISIKTWFLVSLIHYGVTTKKWKKQNYGNPEILSSGFLFFSVIVCNALCIVYSVLWLIFIIVGFKVGEEDEFCNSLSHAIIIIWVLIKLSIHIFLWLRQRAFYKNKMLSVNYSKKIKFLSAISIFVILTAMSSIAIYSLFPENSRSSENGCSTMLENDMGIIVFWVSALFVFIFGQIIMLGLFVYAINHVKSQNTSICISVLNEFCCCIQNRREEPAQNLQNISTPVHVITIQCATTSNATSTKYQSTSNFSRPQINTEEKVKIILRKTFVSGVIFMIFDVLISSVFSIPNIRNNNRLASLIASINALLHLLLLVFSFVRYRKMLFSPCSYVL